MWKTPVAIFFDLLSIDWVLSSLNKIRKKRNATKPHQYTHTHSHTHIHQLEIVNEVKGRIKLAYYQHFYDPFVHFFNKRTYFSIYVRSCAIAHIHTRHSHFYVYSCFLHVCSDSLIVLKTSIIFYYLWLSLRKLQLTYEKWSTHFIFIKNTHTHSLTFSFFCFIFSFAFSFALIPFLSQK